MLMVEPSEPSIDEGVPRGVRVAAAWAWRVLILGAVGYLLFKVFGMLSLLMIPVGISLLLAAMLSPGVSWLVRHGLPKSLAVVMVMIGGLAAVAGVLTIVIQAFVAGLGDLTAQVQAGLNQIRDWLVQAFSVSQNQIDDAIQSATDALTKNQSSLTSGFLSTATTLTHVIAGFFLILFTTFFFLKDGRIIWSFIVNLLPRPARAPVAEAGEHGWHTLISYVRATVLVAFVDALGIGLALVAIRVPLALPLAALVFLGAFIPVVGATLSGAVAVLVALVEVSPLAALLTLLAVIAVQQLEGHVLQPLLLGRAVELHPLGVIMALTTGVITGGIIGALIAVPMVAVLNTAIRYLVEYRAQGLPPGAPDPPGTRSADETQAKIEDRVEDPVLPRVTPSPRPRRSRLR
ncbi:MAG: putative heme transporter [Cryptosporangiaceae bacterium]|nr:putative heme transporter [Cryptosporangiaceae bacterium]